LLSALSGTVEIEKQHAKRMKELREDSEKYSAIAQQLRKENEQIESETEQLKKENERLAVLESKIEELFYKYGINSNPTKPTDKP
jgi:DNA repair ATPase RecN